MSVDVQPIVRTRGDTHAIRVSLIDGDGAALDLTDSSLVLTVSLEEDPPADLAPQLVMDGTIVAPAAGGIVEFEMTELEADFVGLYYYDIQMTDSGGYIRTVLRGTFEMRQDITKSIEYLWTAEGKSTVDGSEGIYYLRYSTNDAWEYSARDSIPILRCTFADADHSGYRYLVPDWPRISIYQGWRISGLGYMDESWFSQMTMASIGFATYHACGCENEPGYRDCWTGGHWPHTDQIVGWKDSTSPQQSLVAGWVEWVFEYNPVTYKVSGRMWQPPADDPVTPQVVTEDGEEKIPYPGSSPISFDFGMTTFGVANAELAWIKLEVLP